ncbi:hypothetical protein DI09_29p50 [Mitosporidium daphniae]|uniref:Transcription initiation factor TFIID subunit 4 n=1 Tax=Mitosporidium daphniae TaxID=1485682 RepID=A0A098VS82_9MICR|nr:uncharacterized protein DI09_29p50 [Mitosporidium daphniae]KGG51684.1 hypothetical protein DI09_29p50 [Mitosporidium daphniae]|eukprot:XP_013238142.1 uncharacterized protein DI09_29p50 [Mitosporidium daphniae]
MNSAGSQSLHQEARTFTNYPQIQKPADPNTGVSLFMSADSGVKASSSINKINIAASRMHVAPNTLSATEMMAPGINLLADVLTASTSAATSEATNSPTAASSYGSIVAPMPMINMTPSQLLTPSTATTISSTREDTDSIQDILANSGVNLKEEAEAILREQEAFTSYFPASSMPSIEDPRAKISSLFNHDNLAFLLSTIGSKNKISIPKSTENGIMEGLLYVLQAKLAIIMDELVLISRHRYESSSSHKSSIRSKVLLFLG